MSQICDVCGKTPQFGKSISHSHRRSSRRWSPNIQSVSASINGNTKRIKACTSCIKAGKVRRATKDTPEARAVRVQRSKDSAVAPSKSPRQAKSSKQASPAA